MNKIVFQYLSCAAKVFFCLFISVIASRIDYGDDERYWIIYGQLLRT